MPTNRNSPVSRADAEYVDLALTDTRPGRVGGAAFIGYPAPLPIAKAASASQPNGSRRLPPSESGNVKVSLGDAVQITLATVVRPGDPAEA